MKCSLFVLLVLTAPALASEGAARGRYYWGAEVESLRPCGARKAYWVVGDEALLKPLRDRIDDLRTMKKPYPWVYVELVGAFDSKSKREGFAGDYDGLFHLRKVVRTSSVAPKDCP